MFKSVFREFFYNFSCLSSNFFVLFFCWFCWINRKIFEESKIKWNYSAWNWRFHWQIYWLFWFFAFCYYLKISDWIEISTKGSRASLWLSDKRKWSKWSETKSNVKLFENCWVSMPLCTFTFTFAYASQQNVQFNLIRIWFFAFGLLCILILNLHKIERLLQAKTHHNE